ncbi:MAG: hypothetical protein NZ958_05440 [Bacteroidia bacterium]|nr:hypothetical protein [Bacteroidia bacterium]MDW8088975.1 hypothetical protein [Bacteroidia bacterium]
MCQSVFVVCYAPRRPFQSSLTFAQKWAKVLQDIPLQLIASPSVSALWGWKGVFREERPQVVMAVSEIPLHRWVRLLFHKQADVPPESLPAFRRPLQAAYRAFQNLQSQVSTGNMLLLMPPRLTQLFLCSLMGYPVKAYKLFTHLPGQLSWLVRLPQGNFYLRRLAACADTAF